MGRIQLFEFEDQAWFPDVIRQGGTDYLRYFLNVSGFYSPVADLLADALYKTGDSNILDLCSGGGGSIESINKALHKKGFTIPITVSDKFPNLNAYRHLKEKTNGDIDYITDPVDATDVPSSLSGFRTMFSAIHHFEPETVKEVLKNVVDNKSGIAIFDGGDRNIFTILGILLFHPVAFLLFTPFFRPFRLSRIFFTYIVPLIPLYTVWDGCVSILRLYTPSQLLQLANEVDNNGYEWKAGKARNRLGMNVAYLIGYPKA